MTESPPQAMQRFAGYALVTVGALILGLSGLCTLGFAGVSLWSDLQRAGGSGGYGTFAGILPFMLILGGVPMLIGFGLLWWGLRLLRKAPRPPPSAPPPG
jgi:hypothetical protein